MQCQAVRGLFDSASGVTGVVTNAVTGSVTLHYDVARVSEDTLLSMLSQHGMVDMTRITTTDPFVEQTMSKAGEVVSKAAMSFVLDRVLGGTPFSLLTILL